MDKFNIIKKENLEFKKLAFIESIRKNSANIFKSKITEEFVLYPQKGSNALIFNNRIFLDSIVLSNNYPLLEENKSTYLKNQDLLKVVDNKMIHKDSVDDFIKLKFNFKENSLGNELLLMMEMEFKKLNSKDKESLFPYLLAFFGCIFQNNIEVNWELEKEEYLIPYFIPYLHDDNNKISLPSLNEDLFNKCMSKNNKTFKDIIINVYCNYYDEKFLSTNQKNYFDKKEYKKVLKKDFDKYFVFPFIDIWELPKNGNIV